MVEGSDLETEAQPSEAVDAKESPSAEPPKVPDVELFVDGFGLMPMNASMSTSIRSSKAKVFDKGNNLKSSSVKPAEDTSAKSPCASSTNIDVVRRYTWKTKNKMTVSVITYGATITTIQVPDKKGNVDDVIAGFDTLEEYFQPLNPYFGATIGRYANVVKDGSFVVRPSGRTYMLSTNHGYNHYHGGYVGFDKVNWRSYVNGYKVVMSHVSDRFNEGYPGTLMAQVTFEVTCDNTIKMEMKCTTSEPTIVNLSHCPYFNLAGHHAGNETMYDHIITINADKYTEVDDEGVTTGQKKIVGGTPYDFRVPRVLRTMLPKIPMGGYDINFCVTQGIEQDLTFQARIMHPTTGRVLEVYSNQPGMQFYTGNLLPDPDKIIEPIKGGEMDEEGEEGEGGPESESEGSSKGGEEHSDMEEESAKGDGARKGKKGYGYVPLVGKQGTNYRKHGLLCIMPQNYPDAVNHVASQFHWFYLTALSFRDFPMHVY